MAMAMRLGKLKFRLQSALRSGRASDPLKRGFASSSHHDEACNSLPLSLSGFQLSNLISFSFLLSSTILAPPWGIWLRSLHFYLCYLWINRDDLLYSRLTSLWLILSRRGQRGVQVGENHVPWNNHLHSFVNLQLVQGSSALRGTPCELSIHFAVLIIQSWHHGNLLIWGTLSFICVCINLHLFMWSCECMIFAKFRIAGVLYVLL